MRVARKRVFGEILSFSAIMQSMDFSTVIDSHERGGRSCALSEPRVDEMEMEGEMSAFPTITELSVVSEDMQVDQEGVEAKQANSMLGYVEEAIAHVEGKALDELLYLDDFDVNFDVDMLQFEGLPDLPNQIVYGDVPPKGAPLPPSELVSREASLAIPGMREFPNAGLVEAGKGNAKSKSEHNDKWSVKRAEQLREALGWDTSIPLGDLPFEQLDDLLSNLFARVVKIKGGLYPSSTLKNMMNGFNRVIRHASELRCLKGMANIVARDFDIKTHAAFARTRLTIDQAIKKSAAEGVNKKPTKVETLTLAMEYAILADVEHQITLNTGCQKRLALYLMCRLGIRGGSELHQLMRFDLELCVDKHGREYIKFEERHSKNNQHNVNRTEEHQFRKTYHSYEPDFILTFKQYSRHLPPLKEGVKPDLFMQPIKSPATNVWYNRVHKVSVDVSTAWLKNMVKLVGLPASVITNKSGRVTLITRMAALGVPDKVGMMISGHHTQDGYSRYDRTQKLKMEAATFVSCNPGVSYESALQEVSKRFVEEDIIGCIANLRPLLALDGASSSMGSTDTLPPLTVVNQDLTMTVSSSSGVAASFQNALNQNPLQNPYLASTTAQFPTLKKKAHATMMPPVMPTIQMPIPRQIEDNNSGNPGAVKITDISQQHQLARYHLDYDKINWDEEMRRSPALARHLGMRVNNQCSMQGASFNNCSITIKIVGDEKDKENQIPKGLN